MLAAIVGGRLQGLELACLAQTAGWRTLLIDRNAHVPARGLCDRFVQLDVRLAAVLDRALHAVDVVIPALESQDALDRLTQWCLERGVPLAFDPGAYAITRSKSVSNRLLADLGISIPEPWPRCGFPIVAKPDHASGSRGVVVLKSQDQAETVFPNGFPDDGWVYQQFLSGPSFSLEVIGRPGDYQPLQVTELLMDAAYDCKAVAVPCRLTDQKIHEIETIGLKIATALQLTGVMDVEVILKGGAVKVLEVDARFPSQTPLAVYHATGCNMFQLLGEVFLSPNATRWRPSAPARGVILKHMRVTRGRLFIEGEHIMADAGPLRRVPEFFGADEALTNYREGARAWVATLVVGGQTRRNAEQRLEKVLGTIRRRFSLDAIVDRYPEMVP